MLKIEEVKKKMEEHLDNIRVFTESLETFISENEDLTLEEQLIVCGYCSDIECSAKSISYLAKQL